jgi:hypothetical protein
MARNVSTKRDFMTFSRPDCELSGNMAENGTVAVEVDSVDVENSGPLKGELIEDEIELVLGRCGGLMVGVEPLEE